MARPGTFKPGNVANPRGRPPVGSSLAECIRRLGGEDGAEYAQRLHDIATGAHDNVNARMQAITILFERGFGKPPQDVNLKAQVDAVTTVVHKHE